MSYDRHYAQEELGANCDHCPLAGSGKFVATETPESGKADIAFVGEAPGQNEAREGKPFIGPSGRLLTIVNDRYGIKREEVLLTNATLCRPLDGQAPAKSAIAACRPRLLTELERAEVGSVVVLGNSAALSVLGVDGITKLRVGPGRSSPYPQIDGVRVIPTIHPAACLRQSDMFPSLVADVGKLVGTIEGWTDPVYTVYDEPDEALEFLRELVRIKPELVTDIEVDIDKETSFDHPNRYGMLCVGLGYDNGGLEEIGVIGENACASEEVMDALGDVLEACDIVAQNAKFDLAGLFPRVGALEASFDTMLASYACDERPGIHALKYQGVEYLGAPQWDAEIKKYVGKSDGYGVIPKDKLYKYNAFDVAATLRLRRMYAKKLATVKPDWWDDAWHWDFKNLQWLHDFLVEAGNELMFLELNGLTVDRAYANELTEKYMDSIQKIRDELNEMLVTDAGYQPINPNSVPQVQGVLQHLRIKTASTNAETLELIMHQMIERYGDRAYDHVIYRFCEQLLVHRREAKMYGTYVKGTIKRLYRGRVYPTFLLHGSTTGRLACRNPNLQNVPRESAIKQLFIPAKEGNVFVQADYSQAELRVLSWLAQDNYFRDILNDETRDLFDELTPQLRGERFQKQFVGDTIDPELWKDIRVRVKAFVYGLGYGRHWSSIAQEYKMPEAEAQMMTKNFFALIPEIVEFQKHVKDEVKRGHDLITPFGRHRRFHLITQENWKAVQNEALAFLPQSTSSDVCLRAMVRVRRDLRGSGAFIRNIVHDSILVDCPSDMAGDVGRILDRRMVESGQELVGDYIQFRTDVKVGQHWGEV